MYEDFLVDRLIKLRMQKGVSAREMSLAIGQNESYINRIENRKALPSIEVLFYIFEYFGVTPAEFFDVKNSDPVFTNELLNKLKTLDHEQLNIIMDIVDNIKNCTAKNNTTAET